MPEIASRKHIEKINQVITQALEDADTTLEEIDAIGVTYGPGLVGALLVGVAEAKSNRLCSEKNRWSECTILKDISVPTILKTKS